MLALWSLGSAKDTQSAYDHNEDNREDRLREHGCHVTEMASKPKACQIRGCASNRDGSWVWTYLQRPTCRTQPRVRDIWRDRRALGRLAFFRPGGRGVDARRPKGTASHELTMLGEKAIVACLITRSDLFAAAGVGTRRIRLAPGPCRLFADRSCSHPSLTTRCR
jgi:hypothetical protein